MPTPDKVEELYNALKADGAVQNSLDYFRGYMSIASNRKQLYEALKADGAVTSGTFEEFDQKLGYPYNTHDMNEAAGVDEASNRARQAAQRRKTRYDVAQERYEQGRQQTEATPVSQTAMGSMGGYGISPMGMPVRNTQGYPYPTPQPQAPKPMAPAPRAGQWSGAPTTQVPFAPAEQEGNIQYMPIEQGEDTRQAYAGRKQAKRDLWQTQSDNVNALLAESEKRDMEAGTKRTIFTDYGSEEVVTPQRSNETRELRAAQRALRNTQRIINAADNEAGFGQGLKERVFDLDNWDFGITDITDLNALKRAMEAFDKGEKLTESQQALLDAKALEMAVNVYFSSDLSKGYQAGQDIAGSLPFMAEFMLGIGSAASKATSKALVKYFTKRFANTMEKKAVNTAVRGGARVISDLERAAVMTGTTGAVGTEADARQRMMGQVRFDEDEQGNVRYAGHTQGEDEWKARRKAATARTLTNFSEMFGEYLGFLGKGGRWLSGTKGGKFFGLDKVAGFIDNVATSEIGSFIGRIESKAQFHGAVGEMAEELFDGVTNATFVGDQTLQDVFDKENLTRTALSVGIMSMFFSGAKLGGYGVAKGFNAADMAVRTRRADKAAANAFGTQWDGVRGQLDGATAEQAADIIQGMFESGEYTDEQLQSALNYAICKKGNEMIERYKANNQTQQEAAAEQSYNTGYEDATTDELRSDINKAYNDARQKLVGLIGEDNVGVIDEDPLGMQRLYDNDPNVDDVVTWAVAEYVSAKSAWDGVQQRIADDAEDRAEAKREAYKPMTREDGTVHPVTLNEVGADGQPKTVYLLDGSDVVLNPDGSIDVEHSSPTLTAYDPEQGKPVFLDNPYGDKGIQSVGEVTTPEDLEARRTAGGENEQTARGENGQGALNTGNNGQDARVPMDGQVARTPGAPEQYTPGMVIGVVDDAGEHVAEVVGRVRYDKGKFVPDENGMFVEYTVDGQTRREAVGELNGMVRWHGTGGVDTIEPIEGQEPTGSGNATADTRTPAQRTFDEVTAKYGDRASHKVDVTLKDRKATLDSKIKALEKAQTDYDDAPIGKEDKAEAALAKAHEEYDNALADYNAWDEVRKLRDQALLAQAEQEEQQRKAEQERKRAKETEAQRKQREAYEAEQARRKAEAEAAEKRRQEENARLRKQEAEAAAANPQPTDVPAPIEGTKGQASQLEMARQELADDPGALAMLEDMEPRTLEEVAAKLLSSGKNQVRLQRDDFMRETGYSAEDVKRYPFVFATADKGGITLARFGEMVAAEARHNGIPFDENDAMAGVTAALNMLGSVGSQSDINGYIAGSRIQQAYDYHNAALAAERAMTLEAYGMTEDEYEAYMSWLEDAAAQQQNSLTDEQVYELINQTIQNDERTTETNAGNSEQQSVETTERQESAETDVSQNGERGDGETDEGEQAAVNPEYAPTEEEYAEIKAYMDEHPTATQKELMRALGIGYNRAALGKQRWENERKEQTPKEEAEGGTTEPQPVGAVGSGESTVGAAVAGEWLIGSGVDAIKSTGYLLKALSGLFPRAGQSIERILRRYSQEFTKQKYGNIADFVNSDLYEQVVEEIRVAIGEAYPNSDAIGILNMILQYPTGLPNRIGQDVSRRLENLGQQQQTAQAISAAEAETDTNPTEGQKEAGNYKKGHVRIDGYDITIEQPKGNVRRGTDKNGRAWEQEMHNTYGYIRGTEGVDGDHIDVFLSDDPTQGNVYVVDQVNEDGTFDEHKVMYGFPDMESARQAYLSNYEDGWRGLGTITPVSKEEFKKWIDSSHRKTKPFSEYKHVKTEGDVMVGEGIASPTEKATGTAEENVFVENFPSRGNKPAITRTHTYNPVEGETGIGFYSRVETKTKGGEEVSRKEGYYVDLPLDPKKKEDRSMVDKIWGLGGHGIYTDRGKYRLMDIPTLEEARRLKALAEAEINSKSTEQPKAEKQEPKPIGRGVFGDIYDQFKGRVKEAFDFLIRHKSGDLLGVFHRDDIGDIDLVWGSAEQEMGLDHIINKHVGEGKDFNTIDEAVGRIESVIANGKIIQDGKMRYVVSEDGYRVAIRKDFDGESKNWIVTAVDYNRSKKEKGITTNPTSASHGAEGSEVAAPRNSGGKDTKNISNNKKTGEKKSDRGDGKPTWDEHVNKVMEAYDKAYSEIEKNDGEKLRKEAAGYSDERLLNTYIRNAGISQIFGKGREGMRTFVSEEKNYKAEKLDDVKANHLEAAPDAARQSFVQDVLRAELDRRGIEYKEDYTFAETSEAEKWYKQNVEGKAAENLLEEMAAVDERERAAVGTPGYIEAYNEKAALADRVREAAPSLSQDELLKIRKAASERGMHSVVAHVEGELLRRRDDVQAQQEIEQIASQLDKGNTAKNDNRTVTIIGAEKEHGFANFGEARKWAKKNIAGEYNNPEIGSVNISGTAIDKYLSEKAVSNSDNKDVHLSALKVMPSIIENSIVGEVHADKNGSVNVKDIVRLYGAISIDGETYRVKTTVKRYKNDNEKTKAYSYEVKEIELKEGTHGDDANNPLPRTSNNSISAAKLLKNIDKSYEKGKKLLDESSSTLKDSEEQSSGASYEQQAIANAMLDRLEQMGMEVSTDIPENRRAYRQARQDNSEEGKLRHFRTSDGKVYGFAYRGAIYLDPRHIDAELPVHEYAHLWCEAFRRLNPDGWREVVDTMKRDSETWELVKSLNKELTDENDIAEEMIAMGSGKNGKARAEAEYRRMNMNGNFGNVWNNIAKAIQDFWRKIGDFLNIKYESAEQVYDQVVKDFAQKINPRQRVEDWLKERDKAYLDAVEKGDTDKAKRLFEEALRENIGNGMTPYIAVGGYRGQLDRLARGVKSRDPKVISEVADLMAPLVPKDAVLVPAPSHSGKATDMLDLTKAIAERAGVPMADVLSGTERESQKEAKRNGQAIASAQMGIEQTGELPAGRMPIVIDNVVNTGNTAEACVKALGKGMVLSLADAADRYKHVASLKSAEAVVRDRNGEVVPLSRRFDLGGSRYLAKQSEGGRIYREETDKDVLARLESGPKEIGYRNVVLNEDGTLGSPMGSRLGQKGVGRRATSTFVFGKWERSDENPDLANDEGKIDLIKPDGKSVTGVDYNPYIHIRPTMVNKQFKQAWERPNLVYVRTEYPASELTSGYKAEKANKSVGKSPWNGGELILSRWDKPIEIVPWEEVADDWEKEFKGQGIPFDIIPPKLLPLLVERGMEILPPHKGMGKACNEAYERFKRGEYMVSGRMFREGEGSQVEYVTYEESLRRSKEAGYTKKQHDARVRQYWPQRKASAERQAQVLNLGDRVIVAVSAEELEAMGMRLTERDRRSKGWYDRDTGKIVVILQNHTSMDDVAKTLLHEGVGHYGLRYLFGEHFDEFLDLVYAAGDVNIRREIARLSAKYGYDVRSATEEYLSRMAEDEDFERPEHQDWWDKVKRAFFTILRRIGFDVKNWTETITDNELRYILWRSYQNLKEKGAYRDLVEVAEDVAMQAKLKVGVFEEENRKDRYDRGDREDRNDGDEWSRAVAEGVAEGESIEDVNARFNEELERFKDGTMRSSDKFDLGLPSPILAATGIDGTRPLQMTQSVLAEHMKKHGLTLEDIRDLPTALQKPLMVYTWGEKAKSHIVITDITTKDGRKITTAIRITDGGSNASVTKISSVHGKDALRLISEINTDKSDFGKDNLKWVDKERTLDWLTMASPKEASATGQEFNSAAKIVKNFENPQIPRESFSKNAHAEGGKNGRIHRDGVNTLTC